MASGVALWQWRWVVLAMLMLAIAAGGNAAGRPRRAACALPRRQVEAVAERGSGHEMAGMGIGASLFVATMAACLLCIGISRCVRRTHNGRGAKDVSGHGGGAELKKPDVLAAALSELRTPLSLIIAPLMSLQRENMAEHDRHKVDSVVNAANKMRELIEQLVADVAGGAYGVGGLAAQTGHDAPATESAGCRRMAERGDAVADMEKMNRHDREFVESLNRLVDENIGNHEFSVNSVTDALSVSRSLLHRKMKAILGLPIGDYIRRRRLDRACELLSQGYNVSETAYRTGFADPSYFSKTFKRMLGITPRDWLDGQKE